MPVAEYGHALGCSITGGYVYRGRPHPGTAGVLPLSATTAVGPSGPCPRHPRTRYREQPGQQPAMWPYEQLLATSMRISAFGEDAAGELYVADHGGRVYRLVAGR